MERENEWDPEGSPDFGDFPEEQTPEDQSCSDADPWQIDWDDDCQPEQDFAEQLKNEQEKLGRKVVQVVDETDKTSNQAPAEVNIEENTEEYLLEFKKEIFFQGNDEQIEDDSEEDEYSFMPL